MHGVTFVSVSELSLGLEAERDIPTLEVFSVLRGFSVAASDAPEVPSVTELLALRRDVLHDPGASLTAGRVGSGYTHTRARADTHKLLSLEGIIRSID